MKLDSGDILTELLAATMILIMTELTTSKTIVHAPQIQIKRMPMVMAWAMFVMIVRMYTIHFKSWIQFDCPLLALGL